MLLKVENAMAKQMNNGKTNVCSLRKQSIKIADVTFRLCEQEVKKGNKYKVNTSEWALRNKYT